MLLSKSDELVAQKTLKDPKSLLQEYIQARKQKSPMYKVIEEQGPPHAKVFSVGVFVEDTLLGEGKGKSKQEAEENAAKKALQSFSE